MFHRFHVAPILTVLGLALLAGPRPAAAVSNPSETPDAVVSVRGSLGETLRELATERRGPLWVHWQLEAVPALGNACCFDGSWHRAGCHLESGNQGWGSRRDAGPGGPLRVLVRLADGEVTRVRGVAASCDVDPDGLPLIRLDGVDAAASVRWLEDVVTRETGLRRDHSEALAVLAYHAGGDAGEALRRLAGAERPRRIREEAIFWIGQTRGEEGARFLAGVARTDPSPELRGKAVFSLSQSETPGSVPAIVEVAKNDRDPDVRKQALFWLAQTGAAEAEAVLLSRLEEDRDPQVREGAIFAISQLGDDRGVTLLIRIAREQRALEVRRQALFWLGQSDDPRAMDFFAEILEE